MRTTPSTTVSSPLPQHAYHWRYGEEGQRLPDLTPPLLSPQMISLSGSGDSWWQRCCLSPALSSSPVRAGLGQKGHRDSGRGALGTEDRGPETILGEAVQTQVPHSCDSAPCLPCGSRRGPPSGCSWTESAGGAVPRALVASPYYLSLSGHFMVSG